MGGITAGWSQKEIEYLKNAVVECLEQKISLSSAFNDTAIYTGRNENSVRNFYYSYLRKAMLLNDEDVVLRENNDYEMFSKGEIHHLLRYIVMGVSSGKSVRQCTGELANNDTKLMLRYQNKYRSIVKRHSDVLRSVVEELKTEGYPVDVSFEKNKKANIKKIDINQNLSEFIKTVNNLYDRGEIDSTFRKNAIYTKAMVEGEYSKMQKATMLYELYKEKLNKLVTQMGE